ncbi:MAG: hypothetical protein HYV59_10445 [Planctomycetes bacterium]|nr:hypothetical protein [Planctomycetota bacterium]
MEKVIDVIGKKVLEISGEDLESKINTFRHLVASLKQDREDIAYLIEDGLGMLCLKAKEMLKVFEEKEILRIKQCLQDYFEKNPDTSPTVLRNEMQGIIKQEIVKGFDDFRKDTDRVISKNIQEAVNLFLGRSNDIIHEFKTAVEILFELPMAQFEYSIDILKYSSFYCIVQEHKVTSGNEFKFILRTFLSQSISRKLVLHEMMAGMTSDVSRNCDRILCDLTSGICTTIEYYSQQLKGLGNSFITQIENSIQRGQL